MKHYTPASLLLATLVTALLAACSSTPTGTDPQLPVQPANAGGTGGAQPPSFQILPSTPPAPGVLLRESFGLADSLVRPHGGKGVLRATYLHTSISGFWAEYPGSKNTQWSAPKSSQTWRYSGASPDPFEMFSPLQVLNGNGAMTSEWFHPVPYSPTAKVPFAPPAAPYELTMDGYPAVVWPNYVAIGFTSAPDTISNLQNRGALWLALRSTPNPTGIFTYELRLNGSTGLLLASGQSGFAGWNQLAVRYDPVLKQVSARVNDVTIGPFPATLPTPKYVAFEGVGVMDNLVVWQR